MHDHGNFCFSTDASDLFLIVLVQATIKKNSKNFQTDLIISFEKIKKNCNNRITFT